jgi:hypothetical protein
LSGDVVVLTEANSEPEAAMICGYLGSLGIDASYEKSRMFPPAGVGQASMGAGHVGPQVIRVRVEDLEAAREALAGANQQSG